jgi:hypothetical protein
MARPVGGGNCVTTNADPLGSECAAINWEKRPCAVAEIDDQRHVGSFDLNREQVLPEPSRVRRERSDLVVHLWKLGLNRSP